MTRRTDSEEVADRSLLRRIWTAIDPRRVDAETWISLGLDAIKVVATLLVVGAFVTLGFGIVSAGADNNTTFTVGMALQIAGFALAISFLRYIFRMVLYRRSLFGRLGQEKYVSVTSGVATLGAARPIRMRQPGDPVSPRRDDRALHEASHAIAVLELGHTLVHVTIEVDHEAGTGGLVRSLLSGAGQGPNDPRPPVIDDLVISLAGPLAQKTPHDTRIGAIDDDYMRAVRGAVMHLVAFPDAGSISDILERATSRAREIVEERRSDIRLIADALLEEETLTGDEVIEIIEKGSIHDDDDD